MTQRRTPIDYAIRPPRVTMADHRRRWNSRGGLILIFALLSIGGALAYSGPSVLLVIYRLIVDGVWLMLWLSAAFAMGNACLRWIVKPKNEGAIGASGNAESSLLIGITSIALGLGMIGLIVLGLGLAGGINRATAIAILGVGLLFGVWRWRKSRRSITRGMRDGLCTPPGCAWLWLFAAPFLSIALIGAMIPAGILWTHFREGEPHGYDVIEYHLQVPREWFEAGRIVPLHHNVFSYFPFNVEMHYLLAMHLQGGPWAGMYLAQLMHLSFVALSVLAVYGLALRTGSRLSAVVAALAVAVVPWLTQLAAIAYDEGGFLLYGTLAIGWAILAVSESRNRMRQFALAGVFAGLACGVKLTAVPEVLVATFVAAGIVLFIRARRAPARKREPWLAGVLLFVLTGTALFAPWMARNVVWTGNPVFPEATKLLGHGEFTQVQAERWERAHASRLDQRTIGARLGALTRQVLLNWQFGYVIVPLSIAGVAYGFRSPTAWFLFALFGMLTIFWLGFTHLEGRFFILEVPLCGLLIAQIQWRRAMPAGVGVVAFAAIVAWIPLNQGMLSYLYGGAESPMGMGLLSYLGLEHFSPMDPLLQEVPEGNSIALIGDARAFWYSVPMGRLRYRTVFDVNPSPNDDPVDQWQGVTNQKPSEWLLIDPAELKRFHQTYWKIPPVPQWVIQEAQRRGQIAPFVMRRPVPLSRRGAGSGK